jgi:hypothetical protein
MYITNKQKIAVFEPMFKKFENEYILEFFKEIVQFIPNAIFYKPASSSGKYHNKQQIGDYGQLIHIYMFFDILNMLLDLKYNQEKFKSSIQRDLMRCVPALHDMNKYGRYGMRTHTTSEHPIMAAKRIAEINQQKNFKHSLPEYQIQRLCEMCERHSGQWNEWTVREYDGEVRKGIMEIPQNDADMLIHECDMLASRSWLTYEVPEDLMQRFKDNIDITSI